jgi:hypothetical protein
MTYSSLDLIFNARSLHPAKDLGYGGLDNTVVSILRQTKEQQ